MNTSHLSLINRFLTFINSVPYFSDILITGEWYGSSFISRLAIPIFCKCSRHDNQEVLHSCELVLTGTQCRILNLVGQKLSGAIMLTPVLQLSYSNQHWRHKRFHPDKCNKNVLSKNFFAINDYFCQGFHFSCHIILLNYFSLQTYGYRDRMWKRGR